MIFYLWINLNENWKKLSISGFDSLEEANSFFSRVFTDSYSVGKNTLAIPGPGKPIK